MREIENSIARESALDSGRRTIRFPDGNLFVTAAVK